MDLIGHLDFSSPSSEKKEDLVVKGNQDLVLFVQTPQFVQRSINRVNSLVEVEKDGVTTDLLFTPNEAMLERAINEAKILEGIGESSLLVRDSFASPLPIIEDLGEPVDVIPIPEINGKLLNTRVIQPLQSTEGDLQKFDDIGLYFAKIQEFCSRIDTKTIETGISGVAALLSYIVEGLGIFVVNNQQREVDRDIFLNEIDKDILMVDADYFTRQLYGNSIRKKLPKFESNQIQELGLQFLEYFSLYFELKDQKDTDSDISIKGTAFHRLGELIALARVNHAEFQTNCFFEEREIFFNRKKGGDTGLQFSTFEAAKALKGKLKDNRQNK